MPRATVYCIVEGQTENAFLKRLLGEHLASMGIDFHAPIIATPGGKGGVRFLSTDHLVQHVHRFLRDQRMPSVTTFFDFYGLPTGESKGWGFVAGAKAQVQSHGIHFAVEQIESGLKELAIRDTAGPGLADRFLPYVQLHELEALFFAEPEVLALALEKPSLAKYFAQSVQQSGGCELINDRPQLAPSKRIESVAPNYTKGRSDAAHAPALAGQMNLPIVRAKCPRFGAWLSRLEALSPF